MGFVQTPGLTVADVLIELQGLILGQDTYGIDAGVDTVAQRKINNTVLSAEGYSRLCGLLRQNLQTAALAAGQEHCNRAFFLKIHGYSSLFKMCDTFAKGKMDIMIHA